MSSKKFNLLQDQYEKKIQKVKDEFEKKCEQRCLSLIQSMKTLRITEVNCCMGSYFFHGDDVPVLLPDNFFFSQSEKSVMDLCYVIENFEDYNIGLDCLGWKPINVSRKDIKTFQEIIDICAFLVNENIPMVVRIP